MPHQNKIQLFEQKKIRTVWDDEQEKWYFSIVDVVAILTDSIDPTAYWRKLKQRLKEEGNEEVVSKSRANILTQPLHFFWQIARNICFKYIITFSET